MIDKTETRFVLGALSVAVSAGSADTGKPAQEIGRNLSNESIQKLNLVSLQSIERTWIQVPASCKARNFNASPVSLASSELSQNAQHLYDESLYAHNSSVSSEV